MATTRHPRHPRDLPLRRPELSKGFGYLTLDPSPRLRKMREEQANRSPDPAQAVRRAWQSVGAALREALRTVRQQASSPSR